MDQTVLFLIFLGVSVGAHVSIAWIAIRHHAAKQEIKWSSKVKNEWLPETERELEKKVEAEIDALLERLPKTPEIPPFPNVPTAMELAAAVETRVVSHLETVDVAAGIEAWLETDRAKQIIGNGVETTAEVALEKLKAYFAGVGGAAIKNANAEAGKTLLTELAALEVSDNEVINGIWALTVRKAGPRLLGGIARWARNRFGVNITDAEFRELGLDAPALESGEGGGDQVQPEWGR